MPRYVKKPNIFSEICRHEIKRRNLLPRDFAYHIGYSIPYTDALLNGARPWEGIQSEKMTKAAEFVGMSLVNARLAAGILKPEDFFLHPPGRKNLHAATFQFVRSRDPGIPFVLEVVPRPSMPKTN